ncbi:MAG: hypothetical protein M1833_004696 [Piccolia ochrophora]|nr:MAG: hypothetical protein M1833_004696 [Piccolia ochrophora]
MGSDSERKPASNPLLIQQRKRNRPMNSSSSTISTKPASKRLRTSQNLFGPQPVAFPLLERSTNGARRGDRTEGAEQHPDAPRDVLLSLVGGVPIPAALMRAEGFVVPSKQSLELLRRKVCDELRRDPHNSDASVLDEISKMASSDEIARLLSIRGWWSPSLLELFVTTKVVRLSLSASLSSIFDVGRFVGVFFRQGSFSRLSSLSLGGVQISEEHISQLRLLPCLVCLDLSAAGLTTNHLLHLITHGPTLRDLNISSNPAINDDARIPLSALPNLTALHESLEFLNHRHERYCVSIPEGYVQDPRAVPSLTIPNLRKNLELHRRCNRDITTEGSKVTLVDRLMRILCGRVADERIMKRVGKA